jgi:hypothetical protein
MIMQLLLALVFAAAVLIPTARILRRAGLHPAWCIVAVIPFINIVGLWLFAHSSWPAVVEKNPQLPDYH